MCLGHLHGRAADTVIDDDGCDCRTTDGVDILVLALDLFDDVAADIAGDEIGQLLGGMPTGSRIGS